MIHAREDYQRFQDPALTDARLLGEGCTPIGEDEPVMIFRAQDTFFIPVLQQYQIMIAESEMPPKQKEIMLNAISSHITRAQIWQPGNKKKMPDMPESAVDAARV